MREWFRKALSRMLHSAGGYIFSVLPRTKFDYQREVGRGYGSSVVMAPVKFIQRVFPEAPLKVRQKGKLDSIVEDHKLVRLIDKPNDFYSGNALWRATIACWILDGNAYWLKLRNQLEEVIELWWIPPWCMEPKYSQDRPTEFITHYEYTVNGQVVPIPTTEVVHFRNGLDPRNPRLGMSDIHSVLREVFSDDEASNYAASILRNMGVPGVIISPKAGTIKPEEGQAAEKIFMRRFAGDNRGAALAMLGPTEVHQFSWSPAQLELSSIRDVSEERVCAILGIPAAVVGFGSGLQQTKVGATMRELVQLAWISGIIPMQHAMSDDIENQLLIDFASRPEKWEVFFDDAMVTALQENESDKARRVTVAVQGGVMMVAEGRIALRLTVNAGDWVYLRNRNLMVVGKDGKPVESEEPSDTPEEIPNQTN